MDLEPLSRCSGVYMLNLILACLLGACVVAIVCVVCDIHKDITELLETWYLKGDKNLMNSINDVSVLYTEEELLW